MTEESIRPRIRNGESEIIRKITGKNLTYSNGSRPRLTANEYQQLLAYRDRVDGKEISKKMKELDLLKGKEHIFNEVIELTEQKGQFQLFEISENPTSEERETVAIAQVSDWHIDEVVRADSVMGMNEFNFDVARERAITYFAKLAKLITHHQQHYNIRRVVMLLQGDVIGGWIHDELAQTNSISPNEAIYQAKSLIISGFKYLQEHLNVDVIDVVAVCGNHTRETRRIQFANFNDTSKEHWMHLDIESSCKMIGLDKFSFYIPKSEMAIITIFGNKYLVAHGHQFKFNGGVGGIFPSMLRWFGNINKTLGVKAAFIGHWHQSIFTNHVIVNNTLKGYDAFAMSKGLEFSQPSQNLVLLDSHYGLCNYQQIYV